MERYSSVAAIALLLVGLIAGSIRHLSRAPSDPLRNELAPASPTGSNAIAMSPPSIAVDSIHINSLSQSQSEVSWTIRGLVRTARGERLPKATICVMLEGRSALQRCTGVNAAGEYEFLTVARDVRALFASAPDYYSRIEPVSAPRSEKLRQQNVIVELDPGSSGVRGVVADATGGFVPGALVTARAKPARDVLAAALSDPDGRFELGVSGATVVVSAEAEGYAPAVKDVVAPVAGLTLTLIPGSELVGRVVEVDSQAPVGDVLVLAQNADGLVAKPDSARSDQDGSFRLVGLVAGRYQVEAVGAAWRSEPIALAVGVGQVSDEITLAVSPAASLHALIQVAGEACPGAYLHLSGPRSAFERAGASGAIRVEGLSPGRYQVRGGCPGRSRTQIEEELVVGPQPIARTWDLKADDVAVNEQVACCDPSGTIRVLVDSEVGGAGGPLRVWAAERDQLRASVPGRVEGDATLFEKLSLGHYDVYLDQSVETRVPVSLEHDGQVQEVRLRPPPRTRISGRVLDERGMPIPDAWVHAINQEGRMNDAAVVPVLSDADGAFTISGLFPTRYEVSVESAVGRARLENVPGNSQGLVLRLEPHGSLSGRVTNPFGGGEDVLVYCRRRSAQSEVHIATGSAIWQVAWIPVGIYEVFAVAESGFASSTVSVEAGVTAEVSLTLEPRDHAQLPAWVREASSPSPSPSPSPSDLGRREVTAEVETPRRSGPVTERSR